MLGVFYFCFQFLFSVFTFCNNENVAFTDHASGIQHPVCSKLTINQKNNNDTAVAVSVVKFSY